MATVVLTATADDGSVAKASLTITSAPSGAFPNVQAAWTPVGSLPISDSAAAAGVIHQPENRPSAVQANAYVPSAAELSAFYAAMPTFLNDQLRKYVTGKPGLSNPSTDDLIQWASLKWGIPTDWIRAQAVQETHWNQVPVGPPTGANVRGLGDITAVTAAQYKDYPTQAQIPNTLNVYQSMGIMQCRWTDLPTAINAGTEPLRWKSTAFCLDYYAHYVRWLYDGYTVGISWIPPIYKGDQWQSIGGWFGGGGNAAALKYIANVQSFLASKPWLQPGF